jgi:hypothetical protein
VTLPVKRLDFFFTPDDTAAYICQYVFDHWPEGKNNCMLAILIGKKETSIHIHLSDE